MAREPVDGDRDGRIYDGTPRERPAPVRLPKLPTADRPQVSAEPADRPEEWTEWAEGYRNAWQRDDGFHRSTRVNRHVFGEPVTWNDDADKLNTEAMMRSLLTELETAEPYDKSFGLVRVSWPEDVPYTEGDIVDIPMLAVLDAAGGENPYEFWRRPDGGTVHVYIPKGAPAVEIHPAGEYLTGGQFKVIEDRVVEDTPTRRGGRTIALQWIGPSPAATKWLDDQQAKESSGESADAVSRPTANRMLARPDVTRPPDDVPLFATADEARQPRSRSAHRRAEQAFRPVSGTIAKGEVESGVDQLASVRAVSREDRVAIGKAIAALPADKAKTLGLGKDHPVWDMARAGEWDDRYAFASLSPMFVSIRDPYADKPPLAERIARPMLAADYVETGMFPAPTTADQRALAERTRNRLQVLDDPTSQRIADEIDRTLTTGVPYTDAAGHYLLGQLEREQTAADTDRQSAMFGPSDPEAGVVRTIDELYEAIGVNALRKSIGSWNESSLSARMVLLQRGIAAEFGVPYDDSRVAADVRADLDGVFDAAPEAWQMVARTMYEDTQALLRDAGVSDLILYRGVDGDTETALTSPITSWSVSPNIGGMFGGRLWQAEVPATAIFATPMTGMGVPEEGELIVLAGPSVDERLVPPAERTGLPRMFDTWIDRDQGDVSALPDEPEPVVPGGPGASLPPSDVPADVAVKRNRVANIDTDRLVRRRQWIEDRIKRRGPDGVGLSGGRLGFAYRALEMQAIEDELDARQVPYERYTMTNAQVRERDATLRANRMRLDTEVSSEVVPTPERPLDVDLSSVTRKGKPAQWTYASGSKPMKVSGSYSRATVNARMKAVRRMMEDELPQLKGRDFTIDYWLDWDEYRAAVSPDETGTYPMARWDEATNRVIISPSVATGLFDEGSEETWRTVMHELVHAASPQAVPNSGPEPVMEEGMAEILSIDIGARRVADFARLRSSGYAGGGRGETGLETLARNSVYKDRTAALILNAGERSGWDRRRTMAMLREWWESGSYQPVYRRIEYRSDGLDGETLRAKRRAEIDRRYDDLIRRLPQHSDEYEADRRRELADVDAETIEGDVSFRARQQWDQLTASARAAGVDLGRIRVDWTDEQDWVAESGLSAADQSVVDTTAASLLYWLVGGDDVAGTAAGESGAL